MQFGTRSLDLGQPRIMGILNVTPDSFSDGGRFYSGQKICLDDVLKEAENMLNEGADILDIGGESTRPGAESVSLEEECDRVLPVVEAINARFDTVISVDSSSPSLMIEASKLGAGLINDVRALEKPGALDAAASTGLPVCLMHMKGSPKTMQNSPDYNQSVVSEIKRYLLQRAESCIQAGIKKEQIILDPGFGFGKTDEHNLSLLSAIPEFVQSHFPILVGLSRKSMIGRLLGRDVGQRLPASLALGIIAIQKGAAIIRVHDVAATADVVKILQFMREHEDPVYGS